MTTRVGEKPAEDGRVRRARTNRAALLRAANEVFHELGYRSATVEEIAARANLGYGTFYNHFTGKDDILITLLKDLTAAFDAIMDAPIARSIEHNRRITESQVERVLRLSTKWQATLRVYREAMAQSATVTAHWEGFVGRLVARTVEDIRRHRELGWTRPLDPDIAGRGLVHMVLHFFWELVLGREQPSRIPEIAQNVTALYFDGLYSVRSPGEGSENPTD